MERSDYEVRKRVFHFEWPPRPIQSMICIFVFFIYFRRIQCCWNSHYSMRVNVTVKRPSKRPCPESEGVMIRVSDGRTRGTKEVSWQFLWFCVSLLQRVRGSRTSRTSRLRDVSVSPSDPAEDPLVRLLDWPIIFLLVVLVEPIIWWILRNPVSTPFSFSGSLLDPT